jgi:hypothetical protein
MGGGGSVQTGLDKRIAHPFPAYMIFFFFGALFGQFHFSHEWDTFLDRSLYLRRASNGLRVSQM